METMRFDQFARFFADRRLTRRQTLAVGAAGLAAGLFAPAGARSTTAQEATPSTREGDEKVEYLFVQSFRSGSLAPKAGAEGTYTLTLAQGLGQTIYFSDRPERIVGTAPTAAFLKGMPFGVVNPPNAALVLEAGADDVDVVVLELTAPSYDEATHTATYEAKVRADYQKLGITFQEAPIGAAPTHAEFGAASLFIDDCPDLTICAIVGNWGDTHIQEKGPLPGGSAGQCWHWSDLACEPCSNSQDYYDSLCNNTYPDCQGKCLATNS